MCARLEPPCARERGLGRQRGEARRAPALGFALHCTRVSSRERSGRRSPVMNSQASMNEQPVTYRTMSMTSPPLSSLPRQLKTRFRVLTLKRSLPPHRGQGPAYSFATILKRAPSFWAVRRMSALRPLGPLAPLLPPLVVLEHAHGASGSEGASSCANLRSLMEPQDRRHAVRGRR